MDAWNVAKARDVARKSMENIQECEQQFQDGERKFMLKAQNEILNRFLQLFVTVCEIALGPAGLQ